MLRWLLPIVVALGMGGEVDRDRTKRQLAVADLRSWEVALATFFIDFNHFPPAQGVETLAALLKPSYWEDPVTHDPWGRPYRYTPGPHACACVMFSVGPDGIGGNDDDVSMGLEMCSPDGTHSELPARPARPPGEGQGGGGAPDSGDTP